MPPPQNPQFAPRKTRKGKRESLKAEVTIQGPSPSHIPPAPPPPRPPPPPLRPPPHNVFFPTYPSPSSTSSTPLPPPSMPKKRFLRRILPIILATNLAVGGSRWQDRREDNNSDLLVSTAALQLPGQTGPWSARSAGYVLLSTPKKTLPEKDGGVGAEVSSTPAESIGAAIPEKTAQ